ncbi:low molecular weight protein-tyrosine-phosphatase [Flammeovirga sp. EKP202]|uniref:low molecular weight protein-tyrosine-phosphatase n=1 Tax=Flammeovirga sp. EKP202 TaxID=2770592 RepID=UPI00165FAAE5|nr:low molecular weight protein-tyrosine-phosphatase [Flammeovirga sp. EKP202]MBD0403619.1 low molecular weight phosphotyrosine protein phosphatase [Flammeovirga sp. EKP202]
MTSTVKVIFVCLGNICRSPLADGLMHHKIAERKLDRFFEIDSAGTYAGHAGERADSRMRSTAQKHGVELASIARQFLAEDLDHFDYVIVMDDSNYTNVTRLATDDVQLSKVSKLRSFDNQTSNKDVDDPYYGGISGFENCYQVVSESVDNFIDHLIQTHNIPTP